MEDSEDEGRWMPLAPAASLSSIGWSQPKEKKGKGKKGKTRKRASEAGVRKASDLTYYGPSVGAIGHQWDEKIGRLTIHGAAAQNMWIEGNAHVKVVSGAVNLLGYHLPAGSDATVNCPAWNNSIAIKSCGNAVVKIQSTSDQSKPTFTVLTSAAQPLTISRSWESACDTVLGVDERGTQIAIAKRSKASEPSRTLICGAKSTGKSTLLRYLVNRHLSRQNSVIVMDCDVGQPEFSPPGMLTLTLVDEPLLSPPHLHMKREHLKAHFYGHVTSRNDPPTYLEMITDLLNVYREYVAEHCQGREEEIPLVVNTDGWVKGFGFEVISTIIERLKPTFVMQLTGNVFSKTFSLENILSPESNLVQVEAYESQNTADIPSQVLRSLRLSTYFFEDVTIWDRVAFGSRGITDHDCEIANTLAARQPYVVSINSVHCEVPFVTSQEAILDALNGSIVGLGVNKEGEMHPSCVGLGIIRSIDRARMLFYILSPVAPEKIVNVAVLLKGTLELPIECVYRGIHAEALPYLACRRKVDTIGGEVMKSRNNIGRKSLSR